MAARCFVFLAALALANASVQATGISAHSSLLRANPIRKVVTLLQRIEKKVVAEGKHDKELFEKAMCYCKKQTAALQLSIQAGGSKASDNAASLEEGKGQLKQLKQDISDDQAKKAAAKEALAEATALREKEAKAFAANKAEATANIDAMSKALDALEKGMAGSFLQTDAAQTLRNLVKNKEDLFGDDDKDEVEAFLQNGAGSEGAGEIVGILKGLEEEMSKDLSDATGVEQEAISNYNSFAEGKVKEQATLQTSVEEKLARLGELGVANAMLKNAGGDAGDSAQDDQKLLQDLEKECADKQVEFDAVTKSRAEELVALADTIKMLNDDDALELFKKALPSPSSSSLMQVESSLDAARQRALDIVRDDHPKHSKMSWIALALHGRKQGFDKVFALIDKMVQTLKTEQTEDDDKKEYCTILLDQTYDSKKSLERKGSDAQTAIDDATESIATLIDEIKVLEQGIKDLDKSVMDAAEQRKEENEAYKEMMAESSAAKELINMAKNRLNKFYNPKLYKAAPKRELSEEDRIAVNMGGTAPPTPAPGGIAGTGISYVQVQSHSQTAVQYAKAEATGVIAMMDLLLKDLDQELTVGATQEKNAAEDYQTALADGATTRAADVKLLSDKKAMKAQADADLQTHKDTRHAVGKELKGTIEYLSSLHLDCDWLLQYYEQRKEARSDEIEAIGKAKDVLKGADYSLVQVKAKHMRGSA